jgi:multidrug efflux pump subunit AcrB
MIATLTFREPRFAALALLVIVSGGLSALLALGRQEDPTITNLFATVTTAFPGADAARVEALVTVPVETALREIPEIDTVESASAAGISIVQIDLVETIATDRIEGIWSEVRDALAELRPDFPTGVQAPELEADGAGAYGAIVSLRAAAPDTPPGVVLRYAEALADRLRGVPGTSLVDLFGAPEEEVLVALDPQRTAALGLTADAVSDAIRTADSKGRAGRLRGESAEMILSVAGEITATERVRSVILREGPDGALIRVADLAAVSRGIRSPTSGPGRPTGSTPR